MSVLPYAELNLDIEQYSNVFQRCMLGFHAFLQKFLHFKYFIAQILTFAFVMLALVDLAFFSGQKFSSTHFSILSTAASCLAKTRHYFGRLLGPGQYFGSCCRRWTTGSQLTTESWHLPYFMLIRWQTIDWEFHWDNLTTQFTSNFLVTFNFYSLSSFQSCWLDFHF